MIGALAGVAVAAAMIVVALLLPFERRSQLFALLLVAAAAIYSGAELAGGVVTTTGLSFFAVFLMAALFGIDRPGLLGMVWFGHAIWDAFHYTGALPTRLPADYQIACFAADIVWAVWLFSLRPRRGVAQQEAPGPRT